jgi:hypothetical protein
MSEAHMIRLCKVTQSDLSGGWVNLWLGQTGAEGYE